VIDRCGEGLNRSSPQRNFSLHLCRMVSMALRNSFNATYLRESLWLTARGAMGHFPHGQQLSALVRNP
jgi:hypothetical protein